MSIGSGGKLSLEVFLEAIALRLEATAPRVAIAVLVSNSWQGFPMRSFVRCYRISWFINNGWYSPALKNRMRELNKWPPPEKYTTTGWTSLLVLLCFR